MKVAFCTLKSIRGGGGVEKYTAEIGQRLANRGHDITVYSMRHRGDVAERFAGIRVNPVRAMSFPQAEKVTASVASMLHAAASGGYDVVHCHGIVPGALAFLPRMLGRTKCVLQFHGLEWRRSRWGRAGALSLKSLERIAIGQSNAYAAVSTVQCNYYREAYGLSVRRISCGADVAAPLPPEEIRKLGLAGGDYVLFASRLAEEKRAHDLIRAFRGVGTSAKLVIAGDIAGGSSYKRVLRELAGDDPRILFPGFVQGRLLAELFANAGVYVLPSDLEGLSISLLEAMSYGRCCLVSDIKENLEAIGDAGLTFRVGDVDDLREKLRWALENPVHGASLGAAAVACVRADYSWDGVTDALERLYGELVA
jgi:glycosyltransferase involved in cell wall biosynthesis